MLSSETVCSIRKGMNLLAEGFYAKVFTFNNASFIHKESWCDGTFTYLKWCQQETAAGRKLLGMPEIYLLEEFQDGPEGQDSKYVVHMKRYSSVQGTKEWAEATYGQGSCEAAYMDWRLICQSRCPDYIKQLEQAFIGVFGCGFNDLHDGNAMVDSDGAWIVTDPCSIMVGDPLIVQKELHKGLQLELC